MFPVKTNQLSPELTDFRDFTMENMGKSHKITISHGKTHYFNGRRSLFEIWDLEKTTEAMGLEASLMSSKAGRLGNPMIFVGKSCVFYRDFMEKSDDLVYPPGKREQETMENQRAIY